MSDVHERTETGNSETWNKKIVNESRRFLWEIGAWWPDVWDYPKKCLEEDEYY